MASTYGTRVVAKHDAWRMRSVARFLDTIGVLDRKEFLDRFTTVIGRTIYAPFEVGVDSSPGKLWGQIMICVHEHQHVVQYARDGAATFSTRYTLSRRARAAYEAEAYSCDLQLHFWRTGAMKDPSAVAAVLRHYGVGNEHITQATADLTASAIRIKAGDVVTESAATALAWLDEHAAGLRA